MKNNKRDFESRFVHFVMNGLLAIIAIIWFFGLAYIYLSWVIMPLFFDNPPESAINGLPPSRTPGYLLLGLNWFLNIMLLWCLMQAWKGDPGYVASYFKSVVVSEEPCAPPLESPLILHFQQTGET